jgi:hypothetical protein
MGRCGARDTEHLPAEAEVREFCNLGYALKCSRLPIDRSFDAVRFAIASDRGERLLVSFVGEAAHLPVESLQMEYDASLGQWSVPHPDARIQKLADCYVQAYLPRRRRKQNS